MNDLTLTQKIVVTGGETVQEIAALACDVYDVVDVSIAAGAVNKEVELYGVGSLASLLAILIPTGVYDGGGTPYITYKIASTGSAATLLGNMHMFAGRGAIQAIIAGAGEPAKLFFGSSHSAPITVKIVVGRDATP